MNQKEDTQLFFLRIFPRCPFYKPLPVLIILGLITIGAWGTSYLNEWIAWGYAGYSLLFYFLVMPLTMCKYCYFKTIDPSSIDEEEKQKRLLSVEAWTDSHLHLHVGQKNWSFAMTIVWFAPIVLVGSSLFLTFDVIPLMLLIAFIAILIGNYYFMLRVKCPTCAIREECHTPGRYA